MMMQAPPWMPSTALAVTLGGEPGWFVSARSVQNLPDQPMGKGVKRGKGEGKGMFKMEKVDNPGLNYSEAIYTGTIKCPPLSNTGYGFIACEDLAAIYPGKDVFMHLKICPWTADMNLQNGEQVQFNYFEANGAPQANRVIRPQ